MTIVAGVAALALILVVAFQEPFRLSYHYSRMLKLRRAELQTKGVAEGVRRNDLHQRYVYHRDFLVRAGFQIEEKRFAFTNVNPHVLYVALENNFPDLDFEMPTRGGRVEGVVVYGSSNVTQAAELFIKAHDTKANIP